MMMRQLFLETPWAFGLFVISGAGGAVGAFLFFLIFRFATGAASEKLTSREFIYTGVITGLTERFFFTLLIGLLGPAGIAQATIGWIAIKGQVHYKMFSDANNVDMARAYLGLLGSLSSLVFAVGGGYVWEQQLSAQAMMKWIATIVAML